MSDAAEITLEYLNECFEPDYEKGILYWKERPRHHFRTERGYKIWNARFANKKAGHERSDSREMKGRKRLKLDYKPLYVHRLLYQMYHNKILDSNIVVDHIDCNPGNNTIDNLRECTHQQNGLNRSRVKDGSATNVKGVDYYRPKNRGLIAKEYRGRVVLNGKTYCKYFFTLEEAEAWVKQKRAELHGEFANDGE